MAQSLTSSPALFGDPSIDHAVAGLGAGTIATLVMHPLDLVKVRFQLADAPSTSSSASSSATLAPPTSSGPGAAPRGTMSAKALGKQPAKPPLGTAVYRALQDAVKQDGWKGLYRGLSPNLIGGASSWGLYFLFYNTLKKQMQLRSPTGQTTSSQHLLAAAEASAVTAMLTNPIWVVKTRIFGTLRGNETAFRGLWDGLSTIYRTEGLSGLYRGSLLTLFGVANGSIQFASYEWIKLRRAAQKKAAFAEKGKAWRTEDEKLTNTEYILASGASKLVAIALTYPYQVIRARVQNHTPTPDQPILRVPPLLAQMWKREGFLSFYKGLGTNALRILPGTCTTFVVYENLVWAFRSLAIGRSKEMEGPVR